MVKEQIYFNKKTENYTLRKEIEGVSSIKKVPIRFKLEDNTAKFRQKILREKIINGS